MPALTCALPSPSLRAQVRRWLAQGSAAGADADAELARNVVEAVAAPLARHGVARLALVEQPGQHALARLEHLLLLVSRQIGFVLPQSYAEGELAHVQDERRDYALPGTRGHQTNHALAFHSDRCDVNLLLYVRTSSNGGQLSVLPYAQAAGRLRVQAPAALQVLFDGFPVDLREERIFASLLWHWRPILWERDGTICGHYIRRFIADSQRHADCPRLDARQTQALDQWDGALEALRAAHSFAPHPGELLLLDNYRVMHARSAYVDVPAHDAGRLALRTWVAPFDSAPLPLALHPLAGSCIAGSFRGGVGRGAAYLNQLGNTDHIHSKETP
ncbi:TauD/TfdA family dioxygenase [Massilia sp. DWR3-1-1]|uniref:TauD/TfdA family dioxygenase n=1 Tax=Massilia sp. DWR3-1-1 TaxID=2804559 RepID=UPI003CE73B97